MATTYEARAHREGAWWAIEVPAVEGVFTQARRLDQVEAMARDAVAGVLDIDPDSFEIEVIVRMPPEWEAAAAAVSEARKVAEAAEVFAGVTARRVARQLHDAGLPVRDVGKVLGVSPQRVSQLLKLRVPPVSESEPSEDFKAMLAEANAVVDHYVRAHAEALEENAARTRQRIDA